VAIVLAKSFSPFVIEVLRAQTIIAGELAAPFAPHA
jgi:hypothetical protein